MKSTWEARRHLLQLESQYWVNREGTALENGDELIGRSDCPILAEIESVNQSIITKKDPVPIVDFRPNFCVWKPSRIFLRPLRCTVRSLQL